MTPDELMQIENYLLDRKNPDNVYIAELVDKLAKRTGVMRSDGNKTNQLSTRPI